jgi:putative DNA primase/helicase
MALAIASGGAFLKYTAPEPRRVLLVDGELPPEELQRMFAQAVEAAGPLQVDPEIHILSADLSGENLPSLVSRPGQQIVEDHLREGDVLMLDALTTLCTGAGPENDAESWDEMQAWLLQLRRAEITTLLLHHDNRSGGQRGTSRKEDVLSQVIQLRWPADYQLEQGARFEVHLTKGRNLFGPDAAPFEAWLQTENDRPWWTWSKLGDARAIQAARLQEQGLTQRQIAKELGVGVTTVNRALARAKKQGR